MNIKLKKITPEVWVPNEKATRFEFQVTNSNGTSSKLEIQQEGHHYFHLSNGGDKSSLRDYITMLKELKECNAAFPPKEKNRKVRRLFFNRETAIQLLKKGYTVVNVSMGAYISPAKDYSVYLCSTSTALPDDSPSFTLPIGELPGGDDYCCAWSVKPNRETYDQYKARMEKEAREAAISDREAKEEREREEAIVRKLKEAEEREEKLKEEVKKLKDVYKGRCPMPGETPATQTQPKKDFSLKDFAKGAAVGAVAVLAVLLGVKKCKKKAA